MSVVETCMLCPRLCRTSCPVATGAAREAAVPTWIAATVMDWQQGRVADEVVEQAITLCTDCGACQDRCHLHQPLPAALKELRRRMLDPVLADALGPLEGQGAIVAIEADDRPLGQALASELGVAVAVLRTEDRLGAAALESAGVEAHLERVAERLDGARVVVADGGVASVLEAAGVAFQWLHEVVPEVDIGSGSCACGGERPLACCGGAGPLPRFHPEDAQRVARLWLERQPEWQVKDGRCRAHLRQGGAEVMDSLDRLLERQR